LRGFPLSLRRLQPLRTVVVMSNYDAPFCREASMALKDDIFSKASGFACGILGAAAGVVGGRVKAAATLLDNGDLKDAGDAWSETIEGWADKAYEAGNEHAGPILGTVGGIVAAVSDQGARARARTQEASVARTRCRHAISRAIGQ
jgi:hypothetical protein